MSESPESYNVVYVTSSDGGKNWSKPEKIPDNQSLHGAQLTGFGGKVWGIITSATKDRPKFLNIVNYTKNKGWTSKYLDKKYKAEGRASVAVLGDRLYVLYRGTNNGVYLIYTTDGVNWTDVGRIGSKYSETHQSPAIYPVEGKLLLAGVGADKLVYYTITDKDGKREKSWTKIQKDNNGTFGSLAFTNYFHKENPEYYPSAVLLRNHPEGKDYGKQGYFADEEGKDHWLKYDFVYEAAGGIAAAPYTDNKFIAVLAANSGLEVCLLKLHVVGAGSGSEPLEFYNYTAHGSDPGIAYLNGELVISFVEVSLEDARSTAYKPLTAMDEKMALAQGDAQWDCKWKKDDAQSVDLQTLIRGCFCL